MTNPKKQGGKGAKVAGVVFGLVFKLALTAITVAVPLLGVWVASSLAVYHNGPVWLAIVAGVLMAVGLPLAWDRWSEARRKRKKVTSERILTTFDRLVARTFVLNLLLLVTILFAYPRAGFAALSTRGDWMLGDARGGAADAVRGTLFDIAGGLEWLYRSATDNPYAEAGDGVARPTPAPSPAPAIDTSRPATPTWRLGRSSHAWPLPAEPHPVVAELIRSSPPTLAAVAERVKARVDDPFLRVKALHDFAAEWLAYDAVALATLDIPSQRAEDVFAAKKAVCAGYSRLLVALAELTGDRVVYVTGHSRSGGEDLDGIGHAWNAAEIDGAWYLIDATWNAGFVNDGQFTKRYSTNYLFTPPSVFALDHFPDDPAWQLLDKPLTRGEFLRQPAMSPRFFSRGLTLVTPTRSQVDTRGQLEVVVDNPRGTYLMAIAVDKSGGEPTRCGPPRNGARLELRCELPKSGRFQVQLFANDAEHGSFEGVGYVEANNS